jgi:HSP20 family protein
MWITITATPSPDECLRDRERDPHHRELPGVTEQDIDLSLDQDVLTIRGEKKFEQSEGGEREAFHFMERSYGAFQRSIRLPGPLDPEQVQASFENGVLQITLPKAQQQERSQKIQIQSGGKEARIIEQRSGPERSEKEAAQRRESGGEQHAQRQQSAPRRR